MGKERVNDNEIGNEIGSVMGRGRGIAEIQRTYGTFLAKAAFELRAIRLQPDNPFTWASGYRMPIYNDNRQFLRSPEIRGTIAEAFMKLAEVLSFKPDRIAGTATAGIPHAATLADRMNLPMLYVRSQKKGHGLQNAIEGVEPETRLDGEQVLLIEDLISTGGSSISAVKALQGIGAAVDYCFSIFTYGLPAAADAFLTINPACQYISILTYDTMLETAAAEGYISMSEMQELQAWRTSPMTWGEERGFPQIKEQRS